MAQDLSVGTTALPPINKMMNKSTPDSQELNPLCVIPSNPQLRKAKKLDRTERWETSTNKLHHTKPQISPYAWNTGHSATDSDLKTFNSKM